jgi:hypothetical protein
MPIVLLLFLSSQMYSQKKYTQWFEINLLHPTMTQEHTLKRDLRLLVRIFLTNFCMI